MEKKFYSGNRNINEKTLKYRKNIKFNVPVIAHFPDISIKYNSILEAEKILDISYHNIFDSCIGRMGKVAFADWEYENGKYWIKFHAKRIRGKRALRKVGFNG